MTHTPPVFVSHGSPMMSVEPGVAGAMLTRLGRELPRPSAILAVSAHWEAPAPAVSTVRQPRVIHDFHGFPQELYGLGYDAPGAPALAFRVLELLREAGLAPRASDNRGLDHGAWVPLRYLYPAADIPVTQLAISPALGGAFHLGLGRALAPLADEGVLVLGSGGVTHNLAEFRGQPLDAPAHDWVTAFAEWVAATLASGDAEALADYRRRGPQARRNHPTEEHFLPLLVALGAAGPGATARRVPAGVSYGILAMDAYVFGPRSP